MTHAYVGPLLAEASVRALVCWPVYGPIGIEEPLAVTGLIALLRVKNCVKRPSRRRTRETRRGGRSSGDQRDHQCVENWRSQDRRSGGIRAEENLYNRYVAGRQRAFRVDLFHARAGRRAARASLDRQKAHRSASGGKGRKKARRSVARSVRYYRVWGEGLDGIKLRTRIELVLTASRSIPSALLADGRLRQGYAERGCRIGPRGGF